jgi:putative DNA methylase
LYAFSEKLQGITITHSNEEYAKVIKTYLAILIDRIAVRMSSFGKWHILQDTVENLFGRQAIQMNFEYPELDPFSQISSSAYGQLDSIVSYITEESHLQFVSTVKNVTSGDKLSFDKKALTAVVTDPPYYDAIAYADISDFFYVWLKRNLTDLYPLNFSTPQTPKSEECTALKHHHNNSDQEARKHFETKLQQIFDAIELQTTDIVSIMYAHQSTEAWTTLCNSILGARMNITGSWPMDTEVSGALKADKAFLESSVTVACRPSERKGYGDFKSVKKDIEQKVSEEVESLYELGFRGADLLTACFGQAVSEFGKYKSVEKSDGSEVTVAELLEMARNAAFDSLLKGVQGDDFTKFYIGWLQLNGTSETDFDDATKFTRVGVNVNIKDIQQEGLLILEGKKMHIAMADEHIGGSSIEGTRPEDSPINQAHRFILLYREGDRGKILRFVRDICPDSSSPLWRLLATLKELLPANDDQKQIVGILQNADDLRQHCHEEYKPIQGNLFEGIE